MGLGERETDEEKGRFGGEGGKNLVQVESGWIGMEVMVEGLDVLRRGTG